MTSIILICNSITFAIIFISVNTISVDLIEERYGWDYPNILWVDGTVPYVFSKLLARGIYAKAKSIPLIKRAMKEFHDRTCIKFVDKEEHHKDFIIISPAEQEHDACGGTEGRQDGAQRLSLTTGCMYYKAILYHLMKTIGFLPMHQNPNRDDHIKINYDLIDYIHYPYFAKRGSDFKTMMKPYDYFSVMHADSKEYSINPLRKTVKPLEDVKLGKFNGLSPGDISRINNRYNCQLTDAQQNAALLNKEYRICGFGCDFLECRSYNKIKKHYCQKSCGTCLENSIEDHQPST